MSAKQSDVSDLLGMRPTGLAAVVPPVAPGRPLTERSLEDVVAFCRANGIRKLSYQGVDIEFAAPVAPEKSDADLQKFAEAMAGAVPSDTEFLGWSAPEFPKDLAEMAKTLGIPGFEDAKE